MSNHTVQSHLVSSMSQKQYSEAVETIWDLYLWFAPDSTEEKVYERLHRHEDTCLDILYDHSGECAGFSVYHCEVMEYGLVMYRGGTIIRNKDRSAGWYKKLIQRSIDLAQPKFLVALTQNPRVYVSLKSFSAEKEAYPNPFEKPPIHIQQVASYFCKAPGLDVNSLVIPNLYGSITKDPNFKTIRDTGVAKMFAERLGENDGFVVVVPL